MDKGKKTHFIKIAIGAVIFLIMVSVLLSLIGIAFLPQNHYTDRQQHWYYHFPKNTVDVLCTGDSTCRHGFSPNIAWHDYGIVAYSRVDSRQCPELTYFEVRNTLKDHDVKVVILGVPRLFTEYDYVASEPLIRRSMDYKHLSFDKIEIAAAISSHTDIIETISYIFPILRYHARWGDVKAEKAKLAFHHERDFWRGEMGVRKITKVKPWKLSESSKEVPEYSKDAIQWYKKTLDLCNKKGVKTIIVNMPEATKTMGMHEAVQQFADSYGADYLDFNTDELIKETGITFDEDFQDKHHLNIAGARKVTNYIGEYLLDHYDVPQWECSDDLKQKLDDDYVIYTKKYKNYEIKLKQLKEKEKEN